MHPFDPAVYTEQKTPFISNALKEAGFDNDALDRIIEQNKADS
jgi:hypothetical protein